MQKKQYDEFKRLLTVTDPLNRTTTYSYDFSATGGGTCGCANTKDHPSLIISPGGQVTAFIYDEEWRRTHVITGYSTSEAATNVTVYDAVGNMTKTISPGGETNTFTYDNRNRRLTAKDPLGRVTRWTNDVAGRVISMLAPDNTLSRYGYDVMDRRIAETNALSQVTRYAYDVSGNLTNLVDANGNVTGWSYDLLNRQTRKTYADNTGDGFGYDALGNLKSLTNALSQSAQFTYDNRNRLTQTVWSSGSAPTITRSYDLIGRLSTLNNQLLTLSYSYDSANQLLAETNNISGAGVSPAIVSYGYDADGRRQRLTYPSGNTVTNSYTARGQLSAIYANNPPPLATFQYDLDGRRTTRALANGVITDYDYDNAGQLTNLMHSKLTTTIASFAYGYNTAGSRTNALREDARNERYGYDAIQQLTGVNYGDSTSEGFKYDPMGNLQTRTNLSAGVDTFTANNLNQYTAINATAPAYDAKGNLLTWFGGTNTYDGQNRLVAVTRGTNAATFVYDGLNRCVRRTINSVTTDFIYDDWSLIAEYSGATPVAEYIHGPSVDEVLARADATATVYYSGDALNSTAALTDGSGAVVERYRYTAFGQPTVLSTNNTQLSTSAYGNRFTFQGREWFSELNLTDHRNRYYAPELQRWLNRDPIEELGGKNLYRFNWNNSIGYIDPLGLFASGETVCDGSGGFTYKIAEPNAPDAQCTREHEEQHIADFKREFPDACKNRKEGEPPVVPPQKVKDFKNRTECAAHKKGKACREKLLKSCPATDEIAQIILKAGIENDVAQIKRYCPHR